MGKAPTAKSSCANICILVIILCSFIPLTRVRAQGGEYLCRDYDNVPYDGWTVEIADGTDTIPFSPFSPPYYRGADISSGVNAGNNVVRFSASMAGLTGYQRATITSIRYMITNSSDLHFASISELGFLNGYQNLNINYTIPPSQSPTYQERLSDYHSGALVDSFALQAVVEQPNDVGIAITQVCFIVTPPTATAAPSNTPYPTSTRTRTRTPTPVTPTLTHTPITLTPTTSDTPSASPPPSSTPSTSPFPTDYFSTVAAPDDCGDFPLPPCGAIPFPAVEWPTLNLPSPTALASRAPSTGVPTSTYEPVSGSITPGAYGTAVADIGNPINALTTATLVGLDGRTTDLEGTANEIGTSIGSFFGFFRSIPLILYGRAWVIFVFLFGVLIFMLFVMLITTAYRVTVGLLIFIRGLL